ncbi:MAG: protein kinase [Saprospiraceae bacterium]
MRYVLSPNYQLKKLGYLQKKMPHAPEIAQLDQQATFILVKEKKKDYLINPEIYYFLKFLKRPQTLTDLQLAFPAEEKLVAFLQRMLEKGIVIPESKLKQLPTKPAKGQRFKIGTYLGKYLITQLLVKKRKVEIYVAKHPKKVIIKALRFPKGITATKKELLQKVFKQEFELMKSLPKHPNLSRLIRYNEKEAFAILKFVKGKTLLHFSRQTKINAPTKIHLIQQIIKALAFLHSHQVIHGDLHHKNIMVSKSLKVTIIDFGLSHLQNEASIDQLRKGGIDIYLAPERINKSSLQSLKSPANYASDIYQLGILMYLIIFDKFPFSGFTWDALYEAIQLGDIDYTLEEEALIPLLPIIKKCLQKNPQARFTDATVIVLPQYEKK